MGSIMAVVILRQLDLHLRKLSALITTKVVSLNPVHGEVYSIQHYVIKFISDLRQILHQ
jgi:cell shape-determining protein MreC